MKKRILYLDLLRIISCLAIVLLHSTAIYLPTISTNPSVFWVANILNSITRFAIPIFVMISGALFLNEERNYTTKQMLSHSLRLFIIFIFWSFIYVLVFSIIIPLTENKSINVTEVFTSLLNGHYHLWFFALIIGLYLITPILRLWVKKENIKYVTYFLILGLILVFITQQIFDLLSVFDVLQINFFAQLAFCVPQYLFYFIFGWYLTQIDLKKYKISPYIVLGASLLVIIFGTYGICLYKSAPAETLMLPQALPVLCFSTSVFVIAKNNFGHLETKNVIFRHVVDTTLGVYAMHTLIIELLTKYFVISEYVVMLVLPICVFSMSVLITALIKKVPILKRVV